MSEETIRSQAEQLVAELAEELLSAVGHDEDGDLYCKHCESLLTAENKSVEHTAQCYVLLFDRLIKFLTALAARSEAQTREKGKDLRVLPVTFHAPRRTRGTHTG